MRYVEAFRKLGYSPIGPRQDWSADSEHGVCLAIWRKEITQNAGRLPCLDTRKDAGPIEIWGRKPGNSLRIQHLQRAQDEFAGIVDVIIVSGDPGASCDDADPWIAAKRGGAWHLTYFDASTGHFAVEVRKA